MMHQQRMMEDYCTRWWLSGWSTCEYSICCMLQSVVQLQLMTSQVIVTRRWL